MSDKLKPEPEPATIEERMLILERTMEVFRQELISQNKKIIRLEAALLVEQPRRIVEP